MKKALPFYVLLFLVAIIAFGYAFYSNQEKTDNNSGIGGQQQISDDTSMLNPDAEGLPLETGETTVPGDWTQTFDEGLSVNISYPSDWEYTPSPTQGTGGIVRVQGENNTENIWVEIGRHSETKAQDESLFEYEIRRQAEDADMIDHRRFILNDREYYQQTIELRAGGDSDSKQYGIYTIFEYNDAVYFVEAYTNNPFDQFEIVSQILASIK